MYLKQSISSLFLAFFRAVVFQRKYLRSFALLCLLSMLIACGSAKSSQKLVRIGIDPDWYPVDFGPQGPYVNGFVEELLLLIAEEASVRFERIEANWDSLYDGLKRNEYDAVLGSLPQYDFTLADYAFSSNFLHLGPVLIVPKGSSFSRLDAMAGKRIGVISGDAALSILLQRPDLLIRDSYTSIPELLAAVSSGEVQGALLDFIPAVNYVSDLFSTTLQIALPPLNDTGLHMIALKGIRSSFVESFNKNLALLEKKKKLEPLLAKWNLAQPSSAPSETEPKKTK